MAAGGEEGWWEGLGTTNREEGTVLTGLTGLTGRVSCGGAIWGVDLGWPMLGRCLVLGGGGSGCRLEREAEGEVEGAGGVAGLAVGVEAVVEAEWADREGVAEAEAEGVAEV